MRSLACVCALAALSAASRAGADPAERPATAPAGASTYVAGRVGPVFPRATFARDVVGVGAELAGGWWYQELLAVELAAGFSRISGRHRDTSAGTPSGLRDTILAYGVAASVKVAPWRWPGPYAIVGLGRYSFTFTERADALEKRSSLGDYEAPHFGIGYARRVARSAVGVGELRYVSGHAWAAGSTRDLGAVALTVGLAFP